MVGLKGLQSPFFLGNKMTDDKIVKMLGDIISELDYDVYKEVFLDHTEEGIEFLDSLVKIVKDHL